MRARVQGTRSRGLLFLTHLVLFALTNLPAPLKDERKMFLYNGSIQEHRCKFTKDMVVTRVQPHGQGVLGIIGFVFWR